MMNSLTETKHQRSIYVTGKTKNYQLKTNKLLFEIIFIGNNHELITIQK